VNQFKFYFGLFSRELWQKKWIFLPLFWLFSIIAITIVFLIPNQYSTRAGIYIDTDQLLARVLKDSANIINQKAQSQAQKVRKMIYSTANLRKVLRSISQDNYSLTPTQEAMKLNEMALNLKFGAYNKASKDYYGLKYTHSDPLVAYKTLKKILDLFIETNISQMSSKNDRALAISQDSLKVRQRELAMTQSDYAKFKQENVELTETEGLLLREHQRLETLIRAYPSKKSLKRSKLTNLSALLAQTPKRVGASRKRLKSANCDFSSIKQQINNAKSRGLTDLHPDLIYYSELLKRQKKICAESPRTNDLVNKGVINSAYVQLSEQILQIKAEINNLDNEHEEAKKRVKKLTVMLNKQPIVMEKLRILEERLEKATKRYREATSNNDILQGTIDLSQKSGLISYEIIEEVQMPVIPDKPNRLLLFIGAAIGALIAAASYIIFKFIMEQRMSTVTHVREAFDLPILGSITMIDKLDNKRYNFFDSIMWFVGFILLILLYITLIQITVYARININYNDVIKAITNILHLSI